MIAPAMPTMQPVSRKELLLAEANRRKARALAQTKSIKFAQYIDKWHGYHAAHMELIGEYVDKAIDGTLWDDIPGEGMRYLFICVPPSYGKSSFVSRKLPALAVPRLMELGKPHQVITASYNSTLAEANNRKVIELMETVEYQDLFPHIVPSRKEWSAEKWSLEGESFTTCKAAGIGAGLTGFHAYMAVVDDPIRDRAAATSPTSIENLWEWWNDVLLTRILPGGFVIGMWTRWTENDPMGKVLTNIKEGKSTDRVVVLRLPAMAETQAEREAAGQMGLPIDSADPLGREPGEPLWPHQHSAAELAEKRKAQPVTWHSLYQQVPRPRGGYLVGQKDFKLIPAMPKQGIKWVWGTDWAITEKELAPKKGDDPDYTAAALVGLRMVDGNALNARLVIAFMERGQLNQHDARQMVKRVITGTDKRYPVRAGQANIDKIHLAEMKKDASLMNFSIRNLRHREHRGDKMERAAPWFERAQAGLVDVVQGPWNEMFFREIEQFPHGAHDDMVDAVSVAVAALGMGAKVKKQSRML